MGKYCENLEPDVREIGIGKSLTSSVGSQKKLDTARQNAHVEFHILESDNKGVLSAQTTHLSNYQVSTVSETKKYKEIDKKRGVSKAQGYC